MTTASVSTRAGTERRFGPFVAVELATGLAGAANGIAMVALPWLVLQLTGSATNAGLVAGVAAIPMVVAALFSGSIVDLIGRKTTSIGSDALSFVSVAAIPIAGAFDRLSFGLLLVLAALGATFDPAGVTARESMLPGVARVARLKLERVNGIHEAVWGVAFLVGPGLGGLLIALVGAETTMWATAACFALSMLCIAVVRIPEADTATAVEQGLWRTTTEGLRFLVRDPLLRSVAIFYGLIVGVYMPIEGVILPVYFESLERPEVLGTLLMLMSLGGVIGALLYAWWAPSRGRFRILVVCLLLSTVPILGMAPLPSFTVFLVLGFVTGLFFGPVNPMVNLAVQQRTPDELLGRVNGILTMCAFALAPVGYVVAGWLNTVTDSSATLWIFGIALTVVAVGVLFTPSLRKLDDPPLVTHEH